MVLMKEGGIPFKILFYLTLSMGMINQSMAQGRARDFGIRIGILPTGSQNAITDVAGIKVGHFTKIEGPNIRTGVTAILPHEGNLFQEKVPAAVFVGNGFGKLAGVTQIEELGKDRKSVV